MRAAKPLAKRFLLCCCTFLIAACTRTHNVDLAFTATWHGDPINCHGSDRDDTLVLTDLRFYVSDLIAVDADGEEHSIVLGEHDRWQQQNLALIDLENGVGSCVNGTGVSNETITGQTTAAEISSLRMTVGVPFALNHANPLTAKPPLDDSAMHWHWRSGYKFLRAGIATEMDGFWLHLGSTGCQGTVQNISSCNMPNRVVIDIESSGHDIERIGVELAALFAGVNLQDGVAGSCSSGPAEAECSAPFHTLFEKPQEIFRVLP